MRRLVSVLAFLVLAGCCLAPLVCAGGCVPTERRSMIEQEQRESIATSTTTDVVRSTQTQPTPVTVTTKDGTRIEVPAAVTETVTASTTATEKAAAAASGKATESEAIPLFVKLIGGAVGLAMLLGVGWMLLRSSRALRAAWNVGDEYLARGINRIQTMAQAETDPARANLLNSIVAALQNERAEFNKD